MKWPRRWTGQRWNTVKKAVTRDQGPWEHRVWLSVFVYFLGRLAHAW